MEEESETSSPFDEWTWDQILHLLSDDSFETFVIKSFLVQRGNPDAARISISKLRLLYLYYIIIKVNTCFPTLNLGTEFLASFELAVRRTEVVRMQRAEAIQLVDGRGKSIFRFPAAAPLAGVKNGTLWDREHGRWMRENEHLLNRLIDLIRHLETQCEEYLFRCLERESQGQADNLIWHLLRLDLISATRFHSVLGSGRFHETMTAQNQNSAAILAPGVRFGIECEPIAKGLVETFVMHRKESLGGNLGLLIDPSTGVLAASVDLAFGVTRTREHPSQAFGDVYVPFQLRGHKGERVPWAFDVISVEPRAKVFEIKCRQKYLRDRDDEKVQQLLRNPSYENLAAFLMDHPVPAVEYRKRAEIPSMREALLSHDLTFKPPEKRSRPGQIPPGVYYKHIRDLLKLNSRERSRAMIFDTEMRWDEEGDEENKENIRPTRCDGQDFRRARRRMAKAKDDWVWDGGEDGESDQDLEWDGALDSDSGPELRVVLRATLENLPIFMNPKHQYYTQVLLQQYILSQYYIRDHPHCEKIAPDELPTATLVSAIFRRRDQDERRARCVTIGSRRFRSEYVPLMMICTPVGVLPGFTFDAVNRVVDTWESAVVKRTGVPVWVFNAANTYLAVSVQEPDSP